MIYLDMDGVLVDFFGGLCKIYPKLKDMFPLHNGSHNYPGFLGITKAEFWAPLEFDFWANLEWTKEGKEIYDFCKSVDDVRILTAFSLNVHSPSGKMSWLKNNIPEVFYNKDIIIAAKKEDCARYDRILIDDKVENIEKFVENDGIGVIVPRPWNSRYKQATEQMLDKIKECIVTGKEISNLITKKLSEVAVDYQIVSVNSRVIMDDNQLKPGTICLEIEAFHLGDIPSLKSIQELDKTRAFIMGAFYA